MKVIFIVFFLIAGFTLFDRYYFRHSSHLYDRTLNVYNWYGMLPKEVLKQFEQETGIHVLYDLYDNNEMLEAKLLAGRSGYDVVFPSASPYVPRQIQAGLYQAINWSQIPNRVNLEPSIKEQMEKVDPGLRFTVPYYWGTIGIAYIKEEVERRLGLIPENIYELIFNPKVLQKLKNCGVTWLEESVDVYPQIYTYLGIDRDSDDLIDLQTAQKNLSKARSYIKRFSTSRFVQELAAGETCVAQAWSGEAHLAQKLADEIGKKVTIVYSVPKEGGGLWIDAIAIPKDAPHPELAHIFINFLLRPDISAKVINYTLLPVANRNAFPLVNSEIKNDPRIFAPADILTKLSLDRVQSLEFERKRNRLWTQIRLQRN